MNEEKTQVIVQHVRNGDNRTSGHDQRQEREGDKEGVRHRDHERRRGSSGAEAGRRPQEHANSEPTKYYIISS